MINNPVILTAYFKNLELTLYIFATKKCGIPSQVGFAWRHALWRKMSALLSLRRPALCDRPASLGSFKWGTRWIHMGDTGKHTGISQPQKKLENGSWPSWRPRLGIWTDKDHSSYVVSRCLVLEGQQALDSWLQQGPTIHPIYSAWVCYGSLHERPSLLLRYLQISNSSSSPADDD